MAILPTLVICVLVILTLCEVSANGTSLMFELPDKKRFCLHEKFEGPKDYVMEYRVIRGGQHDVDVSVKSPNGKILHKKSKVKDGRFQFETSRGDYAFCFGNEFSTWTHKLIYFDLRPADTNTLSGEAGVVKPFVKTSMETSCDGIHTEMTSIVEHQRDYRLRESRGRHIAEGLHGHVTWWSVGQAMVIILAGFGQVFMLKRFFTEKVADSLMETET